MVVGYSSDCASLSLDFENKINKYNVMYVSDPRILTNLS